MPSQHFGPLPHASIGLRFTLGVSAESVGHVGADVLDVVPQGLSHRAVIVLQSLAGGLGEIRQEVHAGGG